MKKFYLGCLLVLFVFNVNAQNYKYGKVSKKEVAATSYEKDSSANAAVLYREQHIYYDYSKAEGFQVIEEVFERVKIYNKEGFDWATRNIDYYVSGNNKESISSLKGETYNIENGKLTSVKLDKDAIFEEEVNKYRERIKFTMPAVKAGSVIEFKYIRTSPFITSIDDIPLQYTIPIKKLDFQIAIPEYYTFNTHFNPRSTLRYDLTSHTGRSSYNISSVSRSGGYVQKSNATVQKLEFSKTIYEIYQEEIPALKSEPYIDYLRNYAGFLKMELVFIKYPNSNIENYALTWENVAEKIQSHPEFGDQLEKSRYFEDDLDAVLVGKSGVEDKISAVLEFVKSKVKWNDYVGYYTDEGVKEAYKEGSGNSADINLMLTAMLKYAGLDANPVLISTKSNGIPVFPTRNGFNYVVASVRYNNKTTLIDATDKNALPNILPEHAQNWLGRLVRTDGSSELIELMNLGVSETKKILKIKFEDALSINGSFTQIASGYSAKEFRDEHENMSEESLIKELEEGKGNIEILDVKLKNDDSNYAEVTEIFNFKLKNGVEKISDNVYIKPMFFMAQSTNPFKADERKLPIFFKYPSTESKTVYMQIPDNYKVESLPESKMFDLNEGQGSYKFIILQSGNFIKVTSELKMNNIVYTPDDYQNLKRFYDGMVALNSEAIVLTKI